MIAVMPMTTKHPLVLERWSGDEQEWCLKITNSDRHLQLSLGEQIVATKEK